MTIRSVGAVVLLRQVLEQPDAPWEPNMIALALVTAAVLLAIQTVARVRTRQLRQRGIFAGLAEEFAALEVTSISAGAGTPGGRAEPQWMALAA